MLSLKPLLKTLESKGLAPHQASVQESEHLKQAKSGSI
jgi:hypothetical protein